MKLPNEPRVLAATYNPISNTKMISFLVDFPTVLLAELRTHRILTQGSLYEHMELDNFNMSANSARAIPAKTYLQKVLDNPFVPIWTKQQNGMSGEILESSSSFDKEWLKALKGVFQGRGGQREKTNRGIVDFYNTLLGWKAHKQNTNRLLAPFAYTTCIISGTEWENFFDLRCPKYEFGGKVYKSRKEWYNNPDFTTKHGFEVDVFPHEKEEWWQSINQSTAQPEFQVIAEMLYNLYQEADWKESKYHIPFEEDIREKHGGDLCSLSTNNDSSFDEELFYNLLMKISASMCAKLSYNTQDNEDTLEKHLERADMLIEHKHYEPFSHQAVAMDISEMSYYTKSYMTSHRPNSINGSLVDKKGIVEKIVNDKYSVTEYAKCYNLTGFIPQRYIIENLC